MTKHIPWRPGAAVLLALTLAACGRAPTPTTASQDSTLSVQGRASSRSDWRDEVIYFALTDRFANGNTLNDNGANRSEGDRTDRTNPLGWHGGDFAGLRKKIEEGYFRKLGFTAIWISPVQLQVPDISVQDGPNAGKRFAGYHGYWAEDFFQTDPHFGSLSELRDLVKVAHKHDLKVIQDVVVNHTGYGAKLVTQRPEWFHSEADCAAATNKDQDCPLAGLPDFKQGLPEVTAYLNDFITFWTKQTGIDGLRMDTMKHVPDAYWRQFFAAGGPGDPKKLWTVGEVFNGDPTFLAKFMDDLGSPSVFDFALYYGIKDHLSSAGGNLDRVADVFARDTAYRDPSRLTTFVDNHDVKRFVSEATDRGAGLAEARERLDLALSLIYTARGTPSVYYGSEIGMAGGGDPYNYPLGLGNREDMDFSAVPGSPLAARLAALAKARAQYVALSRGTQQELWRPNGGANLMAFRRVTTEKRPGRSSDPVVVVLNNGGASLDLASLPGGGIPLLGTFAGAVLKEITGRGVNLRVEGGKLVGTVPARTLLAVSAAAGEGSSGVVNPSLGNVTNLAPRAGDAAVKLSWSAPSDANATGYRVYQRVSGGAYTQLNFAPLARDTASFIARGLTNGTAYEFKVVSVDATGAESGGATTSATPSADNTVPVTFTVDAATQGNGQIELRRFDTGAQIEYPMAEGGRGTWKTTIELPLLREIKFKFGNRAPNARNGGYEAPGQGDRSLVVDATTNVEGVYDFTERVVPGATITGRVTANGAPLANASVSASENPELAYALTFADGTYLLRAEGGVTLSATAPGLNPSASRSVTAPASDVNFTLSREAGAKYTIDGDLSDWTAPKGSLSSSGLGLFGPNNNFSTVKVDADDTNLYLAYSYRVDGNAAILYLDVKDGGALSAAGFEAWRRAANFNAGVDAFIARYGTEGAQLRTVASDSSTPEVNSSTYRYAAGAANGEQSVELAIPWTALGLSGKPVAVNVYGGIFGGDGYGAGDIVPSSVSTPAGNNEVQNCYASCQAVFNAPFRVPLN